MRKLLVIEDSTAQRAAICAALAEARLFDAVDQAADGGAGLRMLLSGRYALVICDVEMPLVDGAKLLLGSREQPGGGPPFVMLTAVRDPNRRAALLRAGARDVIAKPVDPVELVARIELHVELLRLQSELARKNAALAELARTDDLTALPNRRHIEEVLAHEWKRAERYGQPLSVVIADIDFFKRVNDAHGHAMGDRVLRAVADCLRSQVRATDLIGRWGGEEFVAVLTAPIEGALAAAENWRRQVASLALGEGEPKLQARLSLGVAERSPAMREPGALIAAADAALYEAKRAGRDRVVATRG